jgi:hypothetical protein
MQICRCANEKIADEEINKHNPSKTPLSGG